MADLARLARAQRRELLEVDAQLARTLVEAYARAWQRLRDQVDALGQRIQAARDAGEEPDAGWLAREESLRALERAIVAEVTRIARSANGAISAAQWRAIALAQEHAEEAVTTALGTPPPGVGYAFNLLPADAVRALVADLGEGRPLSALLDALGPEASRAVRDALADGLILGEGTATVARRVRSAFGGNAGKATQISRDAVIRSYKSGSLASYRRNADVVKGWRWIASLGPRSCAACVAMHNTEHPLTEEFHDHSRGRCCASPIVRSFAEMGFDVPDEPAPTVQTGAQWFAEQPAAVQDRIAGRAKAAAIRSGAIALEDLAGIARSRVWGTSLTEKSLTSVLGAEEAKKIIAGARA